VVEFLGQQADLTRRNSGKQIELLWYVENDPKRLSRSLQPVPCVVRFFSYRHLSARRLGL
jgi:hypothetical protein